MASTKDIETLGISMNNLSNGIAPFLSVIHAIESHDFHSGGSRLPILRHRHNTFATNLSIERTAFIHQNNCGIFGGGGRSGSFTVGRLGRSGRSGKSGSPGIIGMLGSDSLIDRFGTSGNLRSGN
jgi:hypothetical protein